jgi:NADPH-dependent 7-cyano-7-deazaguanine reductase QueF-like protein
MNKLPLIRSVFSLTLTVSGLAKVAIFTTNVDAENQSLINHKCVCGALNRHFCQTRVQATPPVSDIQQSTLITFFIYYLTVKIE